jgi:murein DD-endopeptidase MepM/ murein hydrolase activator NlpD
MNFRKKTSNVTKVLYIILAMCIISIISLTLYSLFNQDDPVNSQLQILHNDEAADDAADALADIFRRQEQTTEPVTVQAPPPTQRTPAAAPRTSAPPVTSPPPPMTAPAADLPEPAEVIQPVTSPPPAPTTAQPAFISPEDELEESVEVMAYALEFRSPLNGFISRLHNPYIPEFSVAMNDYRTHTGINIDAEIGTNVRAVADGIIEEVREDPLMGKTVVINHAGGITSIYQNLQYAVPQYITEGAQVKMGDVIGGVGQTALLRMMDAPLLHFEMKKDGVHVNPFDFIDFS